MNFKVGDWVRINHQLAELYGHEGIIERLPEPDWHFFLVRTNNGTQSIYLLGSELELMEEPQEEFFLPICNHTSGSTPLMGWVICRHCGENLRKI